MATLAIAALIVLIMAATGSAGSMIIARISTSSSGTQAGNGILGSYFTAISNDGRYVVFDSDAKDLWPAAADVYGFSDVFKKDTQTGETTPVSVNMNANGEPANGNSFFPSISSNGQYVVFESAASDLTYGDTNGVDDIFLQDTSSGITGRVSEAAGPVEANADSYNPVISADGNFVVFESAADNLVVDDTNGFNDIFIRDLPHNTITRLSIPNAGGQSNGDSYDPDIDAYGRYVVFGSSASNLVSSDTNSVSDVFVRDLVAGTTTRISVSATAPGVENGSSAKPAISPDASNSPDGVIVAYESLAANMVYGDGNASLDVFTRKVTRADLATGTAAGTTARVSVSGAGAEGSGDSHHADISNSGRFVTFRSLAINLISGDSNSAADVFIKDTATGAVSLVSRSANGDQTGSGTTSDNPSLNADGRYVAFSSDATSLVAGDTNGYSDTFMTRTGSQNSFTWYDDLAGSDWILLANPASAPGDAWFDLAVAGSLKDLSPFSLSGAGCPGGGSCAAGQVPAGRIIYPRFSGLQAGPVDIGYHAGAGAFSSQRVLWPSGGGARNSLEEVLGTDSQRLSDHFFWTWYDQYWPGMSNWVLVGNPNPYQVYYRISIGGVSRDSGTIAPGANVTPTFPTRIGGPVEVQTWADGLDGAVPANVMASQRVLSNFGNAFNEVPGIPASELSDHYLWTWYDGGSAGARDWILVANPPGGDANIYYKILIAGQEQTGSTEQYGVACKGPIADNGNKTPELPGVINGPVEIKTYSDSGCTSPAVSIASQRIVWGPSFEEVPGLPYSALNPANHWTWYDQSLAGVRNWILVANPSATDTIKVEIWMNGQRVQEDVGPSGTPTTWTLAPGERVTPTFGTYIGGPVEVRAYINIGSWNGNGGADNRPVMASQRVLWNGFFNEVLGTVLD